MPITIPDIIDESEQAIIRSFLTLLDTDAPTLEQIWACMDFVWDSLGCDNRTLDQHKIEEFYKHPVWLLNGLFIEQHPESLQHRRMFTDWVCNQEPRRVADFGGGFGTLARLVASKIPSADIDVIEPHPHRLALDRATAIDNLKYKSWFEGEYDIIMATDVFEHLIDPLIAVEKSAKHLSMHGLYLIANCFYPVIKCHLPGTFHFRYSFGRALRAMKLKPVETVCYGTAFRKEGEVYAENARSVEKLSRFLFPYLEWIHYRRG